MTARQLIDKLNALDEVDKDLEIGAYIWQRERGCRCGQCYDTYFDSIDDLCMYREESKIAIMFDN